MSEKFRFEFEAGGNLIDYMSRSKAGVAQLEGQVKSSTRAMSDYSRATGAMDTKTRKFVKGALQQAGYQVGDYAVQVANGTSAIQAFGQQGSQMLGIFGPTGAILGAVVAIMSAVGVAANKSGRKVEDLGSAFGALKEPLVAVKDSIVAVRETFGNALPVIAQNLDTAMIAAGLFAGVMGVKYVRSVLAASAANVSFSGTMYAIGATMGRVSAAVGATATATKVFATAMYGLGVVVRGVSALLMRFIPMAAILGAAKLIEMFLHLKKGVGGFAEAWVLVKELFFEVMERIGYGLSSLAFKAAASYYDMKVDALKMLSSLSEGFVNFANYTVNVFEGVFMAIVAQFREIPKAFKQVGTIASNALITVMDKTLKGLTEAINVVLTLGGRTPWEGIEPPDLSKFKEIVPEGADIAKAAAEAYNKAFEDNLFTYKDDKMNEAIVEAARSANEYSQAARDAYEAAGAPLESWQKIKDGINAGTDAINIFGAAAEKAGKGGKAAIEEMQKRVLSLTDALKSTLEAGFMSVFDNTKTAKEKFKDFARSVIQELYKVLVVQRLVGNFSYDSKGNAVGSGIIGFLGGLFSGKRATGGPMTSGKAYMVGERGPELVVPSRNATVLPNGSGTGGGVTVIQNNTFGSGVSRAEIQQMLPKIVETTKAAVFDAQRRSVSGMGY